VKLSSASYLIIFVGQPYQTNIALQEHEQPGTFALFQNYPNPFNPSTNIGFRVSGSGFVLLKVFDVLGRDIAVLMYEHLIPGRYAVTFDAIKLPNGVYFYRLVTQAGVQTKSMVLMK
jgi:hypothetical protein